MAPGSHFKLTAQDLSVVTHTQISAAPDLVIDLEVVNGKANGISVLRTLFVQDPALLRTSLLTYTPSEKLRLHFPEFSPSTCDSKDMSGFVRTLLDCGAIEGIQDSNPVMVPPAHCFFEMHKDGPTSTVTPPLHSFKLPSFLRQLWNPRLAWKHTLEVLAHHALFPFCVAVA